MKLSWQIVLIMLLSVVSVFPTMRADDGYDLWISHNKLEDSAILDEYKHALSSIVIEGDSETLGIVREDVKKSLDGLLGIDVAVSSTFSKNAALVIGTPSVSPILRELNLSNELAPLGREGFLIRSVKLKGVLLVIITANEDIGLLYGSFHLLRVMQNGQSLTDINIRSKPQIQYRLLNHWDNLDRSVERGYAGKSLWKWDALPETTEPRYRDYARANASIGINGTAVNNVNANPIFLTAEYIAKLKTFSDRVQSGGSLRIQITEPSTGKLLLDDIIPGSFTWIKHGGFHLDTVVIK